MKMNLLYGVVVLLLMGCSTGTVITTTTGHIPRADDPNVLDTVTTVTETPFESKSFFKSDNLEMFYSTVVTVSNNCIKDKQMRIEAMRQATDGVEYTKTEAAMLSIMQQLLIGNMTCNYPNLKEPKVLADVADQQLLPILNTGLNFYSIYRGGRSKYGSISLQNTGSGSIFFQSDGNMNPAYSLVGANTLSLTEDKQYVPSFVDESIDQSVDNSQNEKSYGLTF